MFFLLIRHGQSTRQNLINRTNRLPDHAIPLSNKGHAQADEVGAFLRVYLEQQRFCNARFRLWVSPYTRTRQTADHVEEHIKPFLIDRREHISLVEQQWGLYDGLTDAEMMDRYPAESKHYFDCKKYKGKFWARMPLGESQFDVAIRVHEMFGTFHRDFEKKAICNNIIVAHGTTNRAFVMQWLHKSPEWFDQEPNPANCSVRMIMDTFDHGYIYK